MAAPEGVLHRFVKERSEPQTAEGSDHSLTRQQMAAAARVQSPQVKLERRKTHLTYDPRNITAVSVQRDHSGRSDARDKPFNILGWEEGFQPRKSGPDMWDTDSENVDNTTTIGSGYSFEKEYSKAKSNAGMQVISEGKHQDQRPNYGSNISVNHDEHMWSGGGPFQVSYEAQSVALLHQDHSDEEDVGDDRSADEEPRDENLTLNSASMKNIAYVKSAEMNDYEDFKEEIIEANCFSMNDSPRLRCTDARRKNVARSSARLGSEESKNALFEPIAHPKSYSEDSSAQFPSTLAASGVKATFDHKRSDFSRGSGKNPKLAAQQFDSSGQEPVTSISSDNLIGAYRLPKFRTVPINENILPQQPKKVQENRLEPTEFGTKNAVLRPPSMDDNELAWTFNKPQSSIIRKRSVELDFAEEELSNMTYENLKAEVFDLNPRRRYRDLPDSLTTSTLEIELANISNLTEVTEEDRFSQQQGFFSSLSIEKYEECGDIMLDRFTKILTNFKEARQRKRSAAKAFEEEVAEREKRVSTRLRLLGKNMERLRRAGQGVVGERPVRGI